MSMVTHFSPNLDQTRTFEQLSVVQSMVDLTKVCGGANIYQGEPVEAAPIVQNSKVLSRSWLSLEANDSILPAASTATRTPRRISRQLMHCDTLITGFLAFLFTYPQLLKMHLFPAAVLMIIVFVSCAAALSSVSLTGANRPSAYLKSFQPHRLSQPLHASIRMGKLSRMRNNIRPKPEPPYASKTEFKLPKFNFNFMGKAEKPHVSRRDIELRRLRNDMYYGKINVGTPGQEFNVVFDNGPALMWILSSRSTSHFNLQKHQKYNNASSSTYKSKGTSFELKYSFEKHQKYNNASSSTYKSKGTSFELKYSFGKVAGVMSQDSVSLAGLTIVNQTFGEAAANLDVFEDTVVDGIVGLGFRNMSRDKETNLLDNMVGQGLLRTPVFSIYISRLGRGDRPSYLTLGGANPDFFTGDFTFVDLSVPQRWQFRMDRIQLSNGKHTLENGGIQAEIQSTTPMIVGPYADVHNLNAKLRAKKTSRPGPYVLYELDCSNVDNLPDVEFIINGETLSLSSKDYVVKRFKDGLKVCYSAFSGRKNFTKGGESLWTLGQVFMRGFYTYFDKANSRIGFAKANHENNQ
ncbi:cathepsin d [Plakobranchus ocellatus]|uniref:Cathepsin d n=1 Tax=Plakobranchus ocellatus TaxID=259542 RepID=A0AAV4CY19_9GAST|nr:cathepsin d [Plakobranchus ocellatus]